MSTPILELAQRARDAGLDVKLAAPLDELPDIQSLLGVAMDPQLAALYRVTNGFALREFFVLPILAGKQWDLQENNIKSRKIQDYIPFLHDVLMWGRDNIYLTDLVSVPALADLRGHQPVVILDANEAPCIQPLASTFNRALELAIEDRIQAGPAGDEYREPFPYSMIPDIVADTRLMQLLDAGAFADLGGGVTLDSEWVDMLAWARGSG